MTPLQTWLTKQINEGILRFDGQRNGIDFYHPLKHPWMEDTMNPDDPQRTCACNPIIPANPTCEGGDDDEED
jgi:hypothetical protein